MKMEMADMNSIITEQIADLEKITKNHRLIYHPGNLRPVAIDKRLIEQVLINLISNAIKYSPAGSDIIISATENEKEIIVKVKDSGIGIPPAAISKIFDRYFRVLNTYTNSISGIGLGLYIVNSIINRHGGVISVQSKEGEGSVFQFTLPFKQVINFS
jgi:signal transduction histidine kinase